MDDYPDMAELLAELIVTASAAPVKVAIALDGAEALAMAIARPYHCVILDLDMPVLDGVPAAFAIRMELGPRAPLLVALTGNSAHRASCRTSCAFDHFLVKPADIEALLGLIASSDAQIRNLKPAFEL